MIRRARLPFALAISALVLASQPAAAEEAKAADAGSVVLTHARPNWTWAFAVYGGNWTNSTLPAFPFNAATGRLTFEDAQIASVIANRHLLDFGFALPGTRYRFEGFSLEAEATLDKHFGLEHHWETTGALVVRSGEIDLGSALRMNVSWGNGLSWALERPAWEEGPTGRHGVDSRRLQYHMSFETGFTPTAAANVSLFMRLHHRSGIYGVISPQHTGSNYVGAGVRIALP